GAFELRGNVPVGWIALCVELRGGTHERAAIRVFNGDTTEVLPPARNGRTCALVEVLPGAPLQIIIPDGGGLELTGVGAQHPARHRRPAAQTGVFRPHAGA